MSNGKLKAKPFSSVIGLTALATVAFGIGLVRAGTLEVPAPSAQSGTPVPMMKILQGTHQPWDKTLPAHDGTDPCNSSRFTCVMGGEAVLDKKTGLVWEQSPVSLGGTVNWFTAVYLCERIKQVGGQMGWRLPTIGELSSLIDRSISDSPKLPTGHPFSNVQPTIRYWSSTTLDTNVDSFTDHAWTMDFGYGEVNNRGKALTDMTFWCVTGGGPSFDGRSPDHWIDLVKSDLSREK